MRSRTLVTALMLAAVLAISFAHNIQWSYQLLYNPSESAPRGWYIVKPLKEVHVDDFVLVRLPAPIASFAARRKYLPSNVPLLKHVSALGGEQVCSTEGILSLNNHPVVRALPHDRAGRPLVAWSGCRALAANEVLLLSATADASYDSRYFGPLTRECIVARAVPLWTW